MRSNETYTPYFAVATVLTLGILVSFQVYLLREPGRIARDEARDALVARTAGRALYGENCAMCHGEAGEGVDGPSLNDRQFLANTADETIFSLIGSGVPGTEMPAWSQVHGGPFTHEEVRQIVAYLRAWEEDAPDREAMRMMGDPVNGLVIFSSTCAICHGEGGLGADRAPALNDPAKLAQFDDQWYAETIAEGRPARGMPTWGTVLSPEEIRDLVALLRAWERGETVELPGPEEALAEAMHMLEHGDMHGVEHELEEAAQAATGEVLEAIQAAQAALEAGDLAAAEAEIERALTLLGAEGDDHMQDEGHMNDDDHGEDDH